MTTAGIVGAWCPINDDEAETHDHKQDTYPGKAGSLEERSDSYH